MLLNPTAPHVSHSPDHVDGPTPPPPLDGFFRQVREGHEFTTPQSDPNRPLWTGMIQSDVDGGAQDDEAGALEI